MKTLITAVSLGLAATLAGCSQGTSGGPGATVPPSTTSVVGQAEDTFSLEMGTTSLRQGETQLVPVNIKRGRNFSEDVLLKMNNLPKGVTVGPGSLLVKSSEGEANLELIAAPDAALGDFTVEVSGHPTKGADAVTEVKLSVAMPDTTAEQAKLDSYRAAMALELEQYTEKFESMSAAAGEATDQTKIDLDMKVLNAKTKLDAAKVQLDALNTASVSQWEKVKEGVEVAFNDLRKQFN